MCNGSYDRNGLDLRLHFRVLWRFRAIVAIGFLLACALAFFSYARISFTGGSPTVTYRQSETWQASVLMFLTQKGFPYGYTVLPSNPAPVPGESGTTATSTTEVPRLADVGRFTQLSVYYAPFAQSDGFKAMLRRRTHISGVVQANAVLDPVHQYPLPYITVLAFAQTPTDAIALANDGSDVLSQYIVGQQTANRIPPAQRVEMQVFSHANKAVLATPRKKTAPVVVFLTVLLAAVGLAFILENLRPRIHPVAAADEGGEEALAARRPA